MNPIMIKCRVALFTLVLMAVMISGCGQSPPATSGGNSTTSSSAKGDEVYLCQSPASTLRLAADKSAGMMINGSAFEGHWSKSGNTIEFKPEIGAPSRFEVQSDGALVETKYGHKFEKISR